MTNILVQIGKYKIHTQGDLKQHRFVVRSIFKFHVFYYKKTFIFSDVFHVNDISSFEVFKSMNTSCNILSQMRHPFETSKIIIKLYLIHNILQRSY